LQEIGLIPMPREDREAARDAWKQRSLLTKSDLEH
jgi:hypothetical protein